MRSTAHSGDVFESERPKEPYRFQEHPKQKYHHGQRKSVVVKSKEEEDALGEGWSDTPFAPDPTPVPSYDGTDLPCDPISLSQRIYRCEQTIKGLQDMVANLRQSSTRFKPKGE